MGLGWGIFHPQGKPELLAGLMEKFMIFLYFWSYYSCYKLHFGIKLCTIKFSIQLDTFQIDDKDLIISNICEKECTNF